MRTQFIQSLLEICTKQEGTSQKPIWLLTGDLGYSVLEPFKDRFPAQYVNVGVAEQNMIGLAAGIASTGKKVFVYSIANFPTLRCLEQIRNDVCFHAQDVVIVSVGAGFAYGPLGFTHHGTEELAIMRSLPGLKVASPADPLETAKIMEHITTADGPFYLRLGKAGETKIHESAPECEMGKLVPVASPAKNAEVAIVATGSILKEAIEAASLLRQQKIEVAVYSAPWIKPLFKNEIQNIANTYSLVATLEEAQSSGGLGSLFADVFSETTRSARLLRFGAEGDYLREAYSREKCLEKYGLHAGAIVEKISVALSSFKERNFP